MRNLNSLFTFCLLLGFVSVYAQPEPGMAAEAGKCYAKCYIADDVKRVSEEVLIKEASTKVTVVPARFEKASEQVLVKEAGNTLSVNAATFETASEQKLAQEAGTTISITPARFETATERRISKEAPRAVVGGYAAGNMGEVGTLSTSAARFETVTEQVLVKEAYTVLTCVPAQFETVTEQKLVQEASSRIEVVPAEYETVTEQILLKEAYTEYSVVPAEYETVTEQVLSKEAYSTISTSPAVYETVTEQKLSREASTRIEVIPAEFESITETYTISEASERWEKRKADPTCLSADPEDCLVWCLVEVPARTGTFVKRVRKACPAGYTASGDDCTRTVEVPAQYETVTYQKLVSPASSNSTDVAAKYTTRTYRKLKSAARTVATEVPAQYGTRSYEKLVRPAYTRTVEIPARYETVSFQKLVKEATTVLEEIPAKYTTRTYQKLATPASANIVPCGKSSILNVNFQTASAVLTSASQDEIDKVVSLLKGDGDVTAKFVGHTDNVGSSESNQRLSEARARAVYQAVIDAGISASRVSYEGLGESQPIATNSTGSGRSQNRRTEFITYGDGDGNTDCNTYQNVSFQRLIADATPVTTEIPARYETYSYEKLSSDASVSSTDIAAVDRTRTYDRLAADASTTSRDIPSQTQTIYKNEIARKGGFTEMKVVVCPTDLTPAVYRSIQQALIDKGYNVGTSGADGVFGAASKAALVKFQRDNGLPVGNFNEETMKALGVNY